MPEPSPEDEIARMRAGVDQAQMGLREMASVLRGYYRDLRRQGFRRDEAMSLILDLQHEVIRNQGSDPSAG